MVSIYNTSIIVPNLRGTKFLRIGCFAETIFVAGTSSTTEVRVNTVPEYSVVVERFTADTSRPVKVIVGMGTVRQG